MKHTILIISLIITSIFSFYSCNNDFLDKPPGVDVTEDTIFSSKVEAETYVTGLYKEGLHSMLAINMRVTSANPLNVGSGYFSKSTSTTDEGMISANSWGEPHQWNNAAVTPDNIPWQDYRYHVRWIAIRRAYVLLEKIDMVPDADQAYKTQVKGEARFFIALNYFEMLKRYGGVPIVDRRITPADLLNMKLKRNTVAEVMDFITTNVNEAIEKLPDSYPSNMRGRVTKGAALMLKSKALLLAASPQFNTATPYLDFGANNNLICMGNTDPTRWQAAADAAKAVIDWAPEGGIRLIDDQGPDKNYKYVWEVNDNAEIILANKIIGTRRANQYPYTGIFPTTIHTGNGGPSILFEFIKKYEKKDGTPQTWDMHGSDDLIQKISQLDNRFAQTVLYPGSYLNSTFPEVQTNIGEVVGGQISLDNPGKHSANCYGGSWQRKFIPDNIDKTAQMPNNFIYRLAEAYLNYAEALNEAQGPTQAAYDAVNAIRNRSGMPDLPTGLSKEEFRERVRNERAIELAFEDIRFWDLRRWLLSDKDGYGMNGNVWGMKVYKITGTKNYRYEPYTNKERTFKKSMYLHPFYLVEINKGYLIQNPGY